MDMEYRRLGKSGLKISALSFGAWVTFGQQIGEDVAGECMKAAYDAGANFFDNAEAYADGQAEAVMGNVLRKMGWNHDTFIVSSKVFWGGDKPTQEGLSRKHVFDSCHNALKRLQVDYLDLYFCHRPDPETPIEETVAAMSDLVRQGKVMYWGTSEWTPEQIREAYDCARRQNLVQPGMEQPQYNLLHRANLEKNLAPICRDYGLGTTIWSPLASGLLTGKYRNAIPGDTRISLPNYGWLKDRLTGPDAAAKKPVIDRLFQLAKGLGVSLAKLSLAWCLKNPNVSTVITGASRAEQVKENMTALEVVPLLTPDVMKQIDEIAPA